MSCPSSWSLPRGCRATQAPSPALSGWKDVFLLARGSSHCCQRFSGAQPFPGPRASQDPNGSPEMRSACPAIGAWCLALPSLLLPVLLLHVGWAQRGQKMGKSQVCAPGLIHSTPNCSSFAACSCTHNRQALLDTCPCPGLSVLVRATPEECPVPGLHCWWEVVPCTPNPAGERAVPPPARRDSLNPAWGAYVGTRYVPAQPRG